MAADWLFDDDEVSHSLARFVHDAADALAAARVALERLDEDAPTPRDREALAAAAEALAETRRSLRALDRECLGDAQRLVEEVFERSGRPPLRLVKSEA